MATLQKIRNRAGWILVAFIGLAMLLFVVDLNSLSYWLKQNFNIGSGGTQYVSPTDELAEIDGKSVSYAEYSTQVEQLAEFYTLRYGLKSLDQQMIEGVREEAWETMVRNYTLMDEYHELGISVPSDELMDGTGKESPSYHPPDVFRSRDRHCEQTIFITIHPDHGSGSFRCAENYLVAPGKSDPE